MRVVSILKLRGLVRLATQILRIIQRWCCCGGMEEDGVIVVDDDEGDSVVEPPRRCIRIS